MSKAKYIVTPRGRFCISALYECRATAVENGYGYVFSHAEYDIYLMHERENSPVCALVPNGM